MAKQVFTNSCRNPSDELTTLRNEKPQPLFDKNAIAYIATLPTNTSALSKLPEQRKTDAALTFSVAAQKYNIEQICIFTEDEMTSDIGSLTFRE